MDIANPDQAELERLNREVPNLIDRLQNEYTKYFNGAEKKPPLKLREQLNKSADRIRTLMRQCQSHTLLFKTQNSLAKITSYTAMWDKKLLDFERSGGPKPRT